MSSNIHDFYKSQLKIIWHDKLNSKLNYRCFNSSATPNDINVIVQNSYANIVNCLFKEIKMKH